MHTHMPPRNATRRHSCLVDEALAMPHSPSFLHVVRLLPSSPPLLLLLILSRFLCLLFPPPPPPPSRPLGLFVSLSCRRGTARGNLSRRSAPQARAVRVGQVIPIKTTRNKVRTVRPAPPPLPIGASVHTATIHIMTRRSLKTKTHTHS
jgi:hypothetical protein